MTERRFSRVRETHHEAATQSGAFHAPYIVFTNRFLKVTHVMLLFDVFSNLEVCTMCCVKRLLRLFLPVLAFAAMSVFFSNTARAAITFSGENRPRRLVHL